LSLPQVAKTQGRQVGVTEGQRELSHIRAMLADAGAVLHGSLHVRSMLQSGFGVGDAVGRPVHEVQTTMKTGYKRCRREGSVMPGRAQRCTQRLP